MVELVNRSVKKSNENAFKSEGISFFINKHDITVIIEDSPLYLKNPPVIQEGRTLVPMRAFFEALGAEVKWDPETRTSIGMRGDIVVQIPIGSIYPAVNRERAIIDVPAQIIDDRTYIPLRFVGQALA